MLLLLLFLPVLLTLPSSPNPLGGPREGTERDIDLDPKKREEGEEEELFLLATAGRPILGGTVRGGRKGEEGNALAPD